MLKRLFRIYKVPLFLSTTLAIVLLALGVVREPVQIALVIIGSIVGAFVLDLEYLIYAYIFEPEKEFSKNLLAYIRYKDIAGAAEFIDSNKTELKDKSLNSAVFQIALVPLCIFVVYASHVYFVKALILSVFVNSLYKLMEAYYEDKLYDWFWALKKKPSKKDTTLYAILLVGFLIYCLYIF